MKDGFTFEFDFLEFKISGILGSILYHIDLLIGFVLTSMWMMAWYVIYNLTLISFNHVHENFINRCVSLQLSKSNVDALKFEWQFIVNLRKRFDDILSPLPFIWYSEMFLKASLYLIETQRSRFEFTFYITLFWIWFFEEIAMTLMTIVSIDYVNQKMSAMNQKLVIRCIKSRNPGLDSLRCEMKDDLKMTITGWKMFKIDRRIVLSYLSALVTFSVLFMQLSSN